MAKQSQQQKAKQIVDKSLTTFTKAIEEVNKANDILEKGVSADEQKLKDITAEIKQKYQQMDEVQSEKINKVAEIRSNKDLIAKLEQFSK